MEIITYSLGRMQANCYFLTHGKNCLIIDPADDAGFILEQIQRNGFSLVGMLATHGHFDHIMAAGEIQLSVDVPLYMSEQDQFLVDRLNETAKYFLGFDPQSLRPTKIDYLKEGVCHVSRFMFDVISTPGHTPGSNSYYFRKEKVIFTGDTLFRGTIGRYDFSYSKKRLLKQSLQRLVDLPGETFVYPGHGESTTISEEKTSPSLVV